MSVQRLQNTELDHVILAALLNDGEFIDTYGDLITGAEFDSELVTKIYHHAKNIHAQAGKAPDLIMILEKTPLTPQEKEWVIEAAAGYFSSTQLSTHVQLLVERGKRKKVQKIASLSLTYLDEHPNEPVDRLVDRMESQIATITTKAAVLDSSRDAVMEWYDNLEDRIKRAQAGEKLQMPTGLRNVDAVIDGLERAELSIVGARPSIGKTAMALQLLKGLTDQGYNTMCFSLEMTRDQLLNRLSASMARVELKRIKNGLLSDDELSKIIMISSLFYRYQIIDQAGLTAEQMVYLMRKAHKQNPLDFVVIDYAQILGDVNQSDDHARQNLSRAANLLKQIAKELNCHIMLLSQVKRDVEMRQDKHPMASDLSESGGLEAAADLIMMLYRDEFYNRDTEKRNILEVDIVKNRNGQTGHVELAYLKQYQVITDLHTAV